MVSIGLHKLNFAFEGDLRGGQVPLEICKSYRNRAVLEVSTHFKRVGLQVSEVALGECVSGTGFEIGFKCGGFFFGFKGEI